MLPLEPGRLSTTTFWPRRWPSGAPTVRAITSVAPPGGNETMIRIGRVGNDCACATLPRRPKTVARAVEKSADLIIGLLRYSDALRLLLWSFRCAAFGVTAV